MSIPITTGSGAASVAAEVIGGLQYQQVEIYGTNSSVITVPQSSSVIAIASGSVLSIPTGSVITLIQNSSIAGTYQGGSGGATHTGGDRGIFAEGVRNDTLASITSADKLYSPFVTGQAGETIIADAPYAKWIQGTADLRGNSGASVAVIAAQGASIFTYIREIQLANMGSASVLVTFGGATDSIIGYSIAPAGGGSNYVTRLKTNANAAFTTSISGVASVLVTATGFISKT